MYHRDEKYAAKEREDREETRFARDRFSLPTGDEDDDDDDEAAVATVRADGGRKSEKESSGERDTERATGEGEGGWDAS